MRIQNFTIQRTYEIVCKAFLPETPHIRHVILGVHGFAGDKESSMLRKLANELVEHEAAVICFDFPAHGESPVHEAELTVENCKKDLLAVARHIEEQYPDAQKSVFATSFGGYIALLCSHQLPAYRYILRAPAITMPDLLLTNILQISEDAWKAQTYIECGFERKIKLPYSFYGELQAQEPLLKRPFQRDIHIFHGDQDDIVPLDIALSFANMNKNTEVTIIKGADHRFKHTGEMERIVAKTMQILGIDSPCL